MSAWVNYRTCPNSWCPIVQSNSTAAAGWLIRNGKQTFYAGGDHYSNTTVSANTWHHVAIVNNAGTLTFYLDGVSDGSLTGMPGGSWVSFGSDALQNDNDYLDGMLDDVRIYNRALSSTEIQTLYTTGIGATPPPPPTPTTIQIGSRVTVSGSSIRVRSTPATGYSNRLGRQSIGAQGTVVDGPVTANGYTWWNVDFDSGVDGWVVGQYLTLLSSALNSSQDTPTVALDTPTPEPKRENNLQNANLAAVSTAVISPKLYLFVALLFVLFLFFLVLRMVKERSKG